MIVDGTLLLKTATLAPIWKGHNLPTNNVSVTNARFIC